MALPQGMCRGALVYADLHFGRYTNPTGVAFNTYDQNLIVTDVSQLVLVCKFNNEARLIIVKNY